MNATEEQRDISTEIANLEAKIRAIAPEVVAGDKRAMTEVKRLKAEIQSLTDEQQLQTLAEQEEQRRAREATEAQDRAEREEALQGFVREMGSLITVEKRISRLLDDLGSAAGQYVTLTKELERLSNRAASASFSIHRGNLARDLERFLRARVAEFIPGLQSKRSDAVPLETKHSSVLEIAKAALELPIAPRRQANPAPDTATV